MALHAQSIPSVHYGVEDGLPTEEIYDICRDSTGYIWLGTAAGLVRFDGITFRKFDNRAARGLGFSNLRTDLYGRVWTQNFRGQLFYVEDDSLHLAHDLGNVVDRFTPFELGAEALYMGSQRQRIYRVDLQSLACDTIPVSTVDVRRDWYDTTRATSPERIPASWDYLIVNSVLKNGQVQISTNATSFLLSEDGRTNPYFPSPNIGLGPTILHSDKYSITSAGVAFTGAVELSVNVFHEFSELNLLKEWAPEMIFRYQLLDGNRVLLSSDRGALLLTASHSQATRVKQQILQPGREMTAGVIDEEGGVWLSSLYGGLYYYPNSEALAIPISEKLEGNLISGAVDTSGVLWLGSYGGTCLKRELDGAFKEIDIPNGYTIRNFRFDEFNQAWLLTGGGRGYIDQEDVYHAVSIGGRADKTEYIRDIVPFGDKRFLVGLDSYVGVFRLVESSLVLEELVSEFGTQTVFTDRNGGAYIAFPDGLYHYHDSEGGMVVEPVEIEGEHVLATAFAADDKSTSSKIVYARTQHHGLVSLDNGVAKLPHSAWINIPPGTDLLFYKGDLLYSGGQRIRRASVKDGAIKSFSESGTMPKGQLIGLFESNHTLIAASGKELVEQPLAQEFSKINPRLVNVSIDADGTNLRGIPSTISLEGSSSIMTLNGDIIHYLSGGDQYLSWQLIPKGDSLGTAYTKTKISSSEGLSLSNLAPSSYTFHAVPTAADGSMGQSFEIELAVAQPLYLRPWFIVLTALSAMLIGYLILRRNTRRQRVKEHLEKRLLSLEQSALKARLNPHFLFNTLNGIQSLVIKGDKVKTSTYVERFSSLMREVLRVSGEQWVSLEREFELLRVYLELEQLRFGDELQIEISINLEEYPSNSVLIPCMLLQPYVENAIIHGLAHQTGIRSLHLSAKQVANKRIEIVIQDSGIGRQESSKINARREGKGGFGTASVEQRIALLKAVHSLDITSATFDLDVGTRVVIQLPLLTERSSLEISAYETS